VERHEDGPDEIADHESHDGHPKGSAKTVTPGRRYNRQQHEIRAEPDTEQVASRAVPRINRDRLDGIDFQARGLFALFTGGLDLS